MSSLIITFSKIDYEVEHPLIKNQRARNKCSRHVYLHREICKSSTVSASEIVPRSRRRDRVCLSTLIDENCFRVKEIISDDYLRGKILECRNDRLRPEECKLESELKIINAHIYGLCVSLRHCIYVVFAHYYYYIYHCSVRHSLLLAVRGARLS